MCSAVSFKIKKKKEACWQQQGWRRCIEANANGANRKNPKLACDLSAFSFKFYFSKARRGQKRPQEQYLRAQWRADLLWWKTRLCKQSLPRTPRALQSLSLAKRQPCEVMFYSLTASPRYSETLKKKEMLTKHPGGTSWNASPGVLPSGW